MIIIGLNVSSVTMDGYKCLQMLTRDYRGGYIFLTPYCFFLTPLYFFDPPVFFFDPPLFFFDPLLFFFDPLMFSLVYLFTYLSVYLSICDSKVSAERVAGCMTACHFILPCTVLLYNAIKILPKMTGP